MNHRNSEANLFKRSLSYMNLSISNYATVTTSQGVLIIGGKCWGCDLVDAVRIVASYNDDGWKRLDDLQSKREGHRAIVNGDNIFVIGGISPPDYEK